VRQRLSETRICICAGAGGVGKTTIAAAIAYQLAADGKRVAVVTIDPARRLGGALAISDLGNEPRRVDARRFAAAGLEMNGELWAMMLDPKRTFDELIGRLAADDRRRDEILTNRIYRELSTAVAGSQEFTAVAKLYDLHRSGAYDAIVLDTPPSRNALDFLSAPTRLIQFFDGRALPMLLRTPTGLATRVVGRGTSVVLSVLRRLTGVDLLGEVSGFLGALSGLLEGFNERAAGVAGLLRDPTTAFVIASSPEDEPVAEAIAFAAELRAAEMPLAAVIVNRVHLDRPDPADPAAVAAELRPLIGDRVARAVAANLADFQILARRDAANVERLRAALDIEPALVPHLAGDVHDLPGLAAVAGHLFEG
jgi:anion-transporting  ArsA/GET3 family ATPase